MQNYHPRSPKMTSLEADKYDSLENGSIEKANCAPKNVQQCTSITEALKNTLERNFTIDKTHNTLLHYAAKLGDSKLADNLMKSGVFLMTVNTDYNTPLHEAFIHKQHDIVDLILNFMGQTSNFLNLKNSQGLTHLHIASTRKNGKIIQRFIETGASVKDMVNNDSPYYAGYTVLQFAIEFKSVQVIEILVRACKIDGYHKDSLNTVRYQHTFRSINIAMIEFHHNAKFKYTDLNRLTDFQLACFKKDSDFVKTLLINGEDVDTSMSRKANFCPLYTPLHFAVEANKKETVKLLTQYGTDIEKRNGHYMTPLHLALYHEDYKEKDTIVDHLYKTLNNKKANLMDLNGLSYFHVAVSRNDLNWVKNLLHQGEDVNSPILCNPRNFSFYTPLHFAVRYGHVEMAELLIEQGVKINGNENHYSNTPLHVAFEVGDTDLIDLLLKHKANVKPKRLIDGKTVLHLLVESYLNVVGNDGIKDKLVKYIDHLVHAGCDIDAKDSEGNTALHIACCKFPVGARCAEALIACGADVNVEDELGQTPLICTYYFGYQENCEDYLIMYHHVQNLEAIGMEINPKNYQFCDVLMDEKNEWNKDDRCNQVALLKKHQQRILEIECMKNLKLMEDLSLFDYLKLSLDTASSYAMVDTLIKVIFHEDLQKHYPIYSYLICIKYKQSWLNLKTRATK